MHSAVTRKDWRVEERMTIEEAIRGWTTWAARAVFQEENAGMIVAGRRADLTVIDIDPFTVEPSRLLDGRVIVTIVDGRVIFDAPTRQK